MPSESIPASETMTDTLTPREAARVMAEAAKFEDAIAERTGGITWMIWGIVTPAIFVTYAFAYVLNPAGHPAFAALWVPWVAMGVVATSLLWRSVALTVPTLRHENLGRYLAKWLVAMAILTSAMFLAPGTGSNEPLLLIGLFWVAMGALDLIGADARARAVSVVAGTILVAIAGALMLARAPIEVAGTVAIVASGVVPFVAGLYHALRG